MKLLRITSTNTDGTFTGLLNEDLELRPFSQIALQSISFNSLTNQIVIDHSNEDLNFTLKQPTPVNPGLVRTFKLTHAAYTQANFNNLFSDIGLKMNSVLQLTRQELGYQMRCLLSGGKVKIEGRFQRPALNRHLCETIGNIDFIDPNGNPKIANGSGASVSNDSNIYLSRNEFSKGCGIIRVRVNNMVDGTTTIPAVPSASNGFTIGLAPADLVTAGNYPNFTDDQKGYFIRVNSPIAVLQSKIVGQAIQNSVHSLNNFIGPGNAYNDMVEISIAQGKITGVLHQNAAGGGGATNTLQLFQDLYDNTTPYYPYIIIHGSDQVCVLDQVSITLDPYKIRDDDDAQASIQDHTTTLTAPIAPDNLQLSFNFNFNFGSESLSNFLGFVLTDNTLRVNNVVNLGIQLIGERDFSLAVYNDVFLIVLQNIKLDSYDTFEGQRRNILSVVPRNNDNDNNIVEYEPNTLHFIDMKNTHPITLRHIKLQVFRGDYSQPFLEGLSNIVVLIK